MSKSNGNSVTKLTRTCLAPMTKHAYRDKPDKQVITKQQIETMKAIYTQLQEMQTELHMLVSVFDHADPRIPKDSDGEIVNEAEEASELLNIAYRMIDRAQRQITSWLSAKGKVGKDDFDKIIEAVGKRYNEYI